MISVFIVQRTALDAYRACAEDYVTFIEKHSLDEPLPVNLELALEASVEGKIPVQASFSDCSSVATHDGKNN